MNSDKMKDSIRAFIMKRVNNRKFNDSDNIFKLGFVDSMFALQLVSFVETEFQIAVQDDDLEIENFNSVDAIQGFVRSKKDDSVANSAAL